MKSLRVLLVAGAIVLLTLLAACEQGTTPAEPAEEIPAEEIPAEEAPAEEMPAEEVPAEEMPAEEVPAEEPTQQQPSGQEEPGPASLTYWASLTPEAERLMRQQLDIFAQEAAVPVELKIVPEERMLEELQAALKAEAAPDVALLPYNGVAAEQQRGELSPLEQWVNQEPFLPQALEAALIDGQLYGLPQVRAACLPVYRYLVIFEWTPYREEAARLLDYLTAPAQQEENLAVLQWYPTLNELNVGCGEEIPIVRPSPERVAQIMADARALEESLRPLLDKLAAEYGSDGLRVNSLRATAPPPELVGSRPGAGLASAPQAQQEDLGVSAPFSTEVDEAAMLEALPRGAFIGVVRITPPMQLVDAYGAPVEPGAYVVQARAEDPFSPEPLVMLLGEAAQWEVIGRAEPTAANVGPPDSFVEEGSFSFCWSLDSRRFCIQIG